MGWGLVKGYLVFFPSGEKSLFAILQKHLLCSLYCEQAHKFEQVYPNCFEFSVLSVPEGSKGQVFAPRYGDRRQAQRLWQSQRNTPLRNWLSEEANVITRSPGHACCHKKGVSQRHFQDTAVGSYKTLIYFTVSARLLSLCPTPFVFPFLSLFFFLLKTLETWTVYFYGLMVFLNGKRLRNILREALLPCSTIWLVACRSLKTRCSVSDLNPSWLAAVPQWHELCVFGGFILGTLPRSLGLLLNEVSFSLMSYCWL